MALHYIIVFLIFLKLIVYYLKSNTLSKDDGENNDKTTEAAAKSDSIRSIDEKQVNTKQDTPILGVIFS